MKKNEYMKPVVRVTKLMHQQCLLNGSPKVNTVSSNLGADAFEYKEGGTGDARGREYDCWGDEDEE